MISEHDHCAKSLHIKISEVEKRDEVLIQSKRDYTKAIEDYKAFKKSHTDEQKLLTAIDTSSEENIQDSEMIQ